VYEGSQLIGLFLLQHPELIKHKRIIELGCGVGALGVLLSTKTECSHVCITDGSAEALQLAEVNTAATANVSVAKLYWGNAAHEAAVLQNGGAYDVCIGADLMYYNVDTAQLVATALHMIEGNSTGFILLAHLFRSPVMQDQLIELAKQRGLVILHVPIESFTTESDRECIHCWYNLKLLLVYAAAAVADAVDHPCSTFITTGIAHELQSAIDDASDSSERGHQQELICCFDDTLFE
jgi:predicted nicotinamide N-methyase